MTSDPGPGTSPKLSGKQSQYVWYAAILTAAVIALIALGVSPGTLVVTALVLACPLMMFFMMRGMHGGGDGHGGHGGHGGGDDRDRRAQH